jgi:23S rRNA (pseudouridine1915-N3)-methyltransferase
VTYSLVLPEEKPRGFYKSAADEYMKRLRRYCNLQMVFGAQGQTPRALRVGVGVGGKNLSSDEFAAQVKAWEQTGVVSRVWFCIGETGDTDQLLALSSQILPWDLLAVLLLEQLYRAYRIIHGQTYHK